MPQIADYLHLEDGYYDKPGPDAGRRHDAMQRGLVDNPETWGEPPMPAAPPHPTVENTNNQYT